MDLEPQINKAVAEIKLDTEFKRKWAVILTKIKEHSVSLHLLPRKASYSLLASDLVLDRSPVQGAVSVSMLRAPYGKPQAGDQA